MAGIITAGAYTLASLGEYAVIPTRIVPFLGVLLGLLLLAHFAVRWLAPGADPTMLPLAAILHGLGYVMITRLDDRSAGLQTTWSIVAIAGFIATLLVIQRAPDLARYRWSFLFAGVGLLLLPMIPGLGFGVGGARIWVSLGPINFQPGEFAKLALAIFFAGYLAENRELIADSNWKVGPFRLPEPRHLLPILLAWGFTVLVMVAQRDLGSSLLFFALFVVMMWVATERAAYLVIGLLMFAVAAYVAWRLFGHVQTRVTIWLDPWSDRLDSGYQIVQALYGLSDGGIAGTGLGLGSPGTVPEAQNDFIFTSIGEEMGLFGGTAVADGLRPADRGRAAHRAAHGQHVREAVVRGPDDDPRGAGVHHHRRRHQGRAIDRDHAPVRQLRRLVAAVELHPAGPADPAQRLGGPPPARAARRADPVGALGGLPPAPPGRRRRRGAGRMNRQIRQLAVGLMACYVVLFVALNYWQVGRQQELTGHIDNTRAVRREFDQPRGPIVTVDGVTAAQSVENPAGSDFTYQRQYPTGDLFADVTGYYTFAFGSTGLERTQNAVLTGDTPNSSCATCPGSSPAATRRAPSA